MKNMHMYIDEELGKTKKKGEKEIKDCIIKAFERVEADWVNTARTAFHAGYPHAARVGACALVAVVVDNKLYVANAGDSKAALIRKNGDIYERIKVSKTFNANKKYE
jgi:serine/threonine protein phosphatase PrpC